VINPGVGSTAAGQAESVAQMVNRETVVLLGWGRAILCQLAHPLVAAAVAEHSPFRDGPLAYVRRARRTVDAMLTLTFGRPDEIQAAADRINAVHRRINGTLRAPAGPFPAGTRFSAEDPELLRWVYATLLDSLPRAYAAFVRPLAADEWDRYCAEAAAAAPLLALPDALVPHSRRELGLYLDRMLEGGQIVVTPVARDMAWALFEPRLGPATPLFRLARTATIGLLPARLRAGYGFDWAATEQAEFRRLAARIRRMRSLVPPAAREWRRARRPAPLSGAPRTP